LPFFLEKVVFGLPGKGIHCFLATAQTQSETTVVHWAFFNVPLEAGLKRPLKTINCL